MAIVAQGDTVTYNGAGTTLETARGVVLMQTAASAAIASASAGIYRRSAAVSATAADGVIVTGVTTAGTVNLTLQNGGSLAVNVPLGSTILPFAVTAATLGTAVGGTFQSLFFT